MRNIDMLYFIYIYIYLTNLSTDKIDRNYQYKYK